RLDLVVLQYPVDPGLLHVEDLAPDRQDGLEHGDPAALGRATGRVTLDHVDLAQGRVRGLAVGQLARQRTGLQQALAPGQVAGLPGREAGPRGLHRLGDDVL